MNAKEAGRMLGGSIVIYVVMAACSAASGPQSTASRDGGSGSGSSGGSTGDGSGGILDALTDPISSASADPNQSGTRLKLNYYAGADGSKQSVGTMHDSMLNADCYFETASDGSTRCLPAGGGASGLFADSLCTQPIALAATGCSAPAYVTTSETPAGCSGGTQVHVFNVGAPFSGATAYYGSTKSCTIYSAASLATLEQGGNLYSVGSELPPGTFVQATVQTE